MMIKPWSCCTILAFAIVSFGHILFLTHAEKISDYRLCGDRSCQTLLSKARTLARHKPTDPTFLPFERGAMIDIYSKSAGSRQDLWGGELNGRRGYFPRSFVREYKVEYQNPQHVVETEHHVPIEDRVRGVPEREQVPPSARTVHPDGTNQQQAHEDKKEDTSEALSQNKKESDEEKKQETTDAVDETEIGDETELADEEQEVVETVSVFIDDTDPPSNMKTDSTAAETQEQQQPADVESKDSTKVDETEIDDDETETAETEDGEETSKADDRIEPGMTEDEKEIEKIADETETSKTEDETEIGETEIEEKEEEAATGKTDDAEKQEVEKQADGSIDTDRLAGDTSTDIAEENENVDKMEQMQTSDRDALTSREKEETNEAKTDETDKGDEEGTMFGNIWSDESEDEDMGVCSAYDSGSTAVVGSFGKKEAEQDGPRTDDEGSKDRIEEETKDTKAVEEDLTERKEKEGRDASSIGEKQQEKSLDMGHGENKLETETLDSTQDIQKPVTNSNEIKDENEGTKVTETDEKIEEISKTMVDENGEQKDISKDDLKFIDDKGEVIQDGIGQQLKSDEDKQKDQKADSNVKEMELSETKINMHDEEKGQDAGIHEEDGGQGDIINQNINKEQIELDEQKLKKFEQLASGMMSILATPSLSESSTLMPSSVVDQETDLNEAGIESATEAMKETLSTYTYSPVAVSQTLNEQKANSVSQEAEASEPVQEGDRTGGIVIDGTTFDAGDFGDETTSYTVQATQRIEPTSSMLENSFYTPAGIVKPTKLFDMPNDAEQTLLSPELQQNLQYDSRYPPVNQQTVQTDAGKPESIQATESNIKEPTGQEIEPSDKGNILQTSFGFATQSVEDTYTLPVDEVRVAVETEIVKNNETVSSDNVQDQVQPSLDQNAYKTDIFISRKPLSTEPAPAEKTAETNIQSQEAGTEDKQVNEEQTTPSGVTDENNNDNNRKVDEDATNKGDWTMFGNEERVDESVTLPTTGSPEPYSSDEHVLSRQLPDPGLDEEMKQSEEVFMKTLESYMRTLINMLPPSLQTVLEQEPVGLSPTVTMLVSLISTNVLALLTCLGCVCKGKKKPVGRKDPLVVIRDLEEKLFIATKEKENLEDDLQVKSKKIVEVQQELNSQQSTTGTVETDLKTIQLHNEALKKQLLDAQEKLEDYKQEVTEKSQVATYKESELQTYQAEVQTLAQRAQDAELALQKTSQSLGEKEEELRVSLLQVQSQSEQIHQLDTSKQQLQDEAVDWSEKMKELTEQTEQYSTDSKRMQEDLAFKENELEVLRDCFLQVKAFQGEEMREETDESPDLKEKLKQMMDVSRVNASLRSVEEERDVVQNKLLIEVESRKELEDQVQLLKRKFEGNQTDKMKAERQCQEAQTKLEVLSKYFKEKETELTRQLGEQEVLKNQNISRLQSSDSITVELTKENEVYRQQIEDLKTEITKAERDFRSQIAANEKKAHENWLATRAAERELKEARHECGMLRQKLTDLERKLMQGPPPGLIRPITHRAMPPLPGMMNGPPPPPPPERPGSRGSVHGRVTPRLREDDYRASPIGPDRMPPPDRRHPPGPMGPRPPPPPLDAMSPPPYAIRPPFPPDRRSPPSFDRYPPPRGPRPPFPRPPPPHLRSPPLIGSIPSEHDDSRQDPVSPYNRAPQGSRDRGTTRHQSQV